MHQPDLALACGMLKNAALQAVADFWDRGYAWVPEVFLRTAATARRRGHPVIETPLAEENGILHEARVVANALVCREHYRLTLSASGFSDTKPGQFVHLHPTPVRKKNVSHGSSPNGDGESMQRSSNSILRRAFSLAGLRRDGDLVELDIIYRVVGSGTRQMASLVTGDSVSLLGPLGNGFTIPQAGTEAWLVAGGVGLPPMLWLCRTLHEAGVRAVLFYGAQSSDLIALNIDPNATPSTDGSSAPPVVKEVAKYNTGVVLCTDDGSLGFHGYVSEAMIAYHQANPAPPDSRTIFTCGPEVMMREVSRLASVRNIACQVCMERSMGCGTGMCQSCVVPVHDHEAEDGWAYRLCCTEGPVFDSTQVIWE